MAATYRYSHTGLGASRPAARVRWDRLGRLAMLGVLAALVFLYLSAGISLLSTWEESRRTEAAVGRMTHEQRALEYRRAALESPGSVEEQARRLGMVFPGEREYMVQGLPTH